MKQSIPMMTTPRQSTPAGLISNVTHSPTIEPSNPQPRFYRIEVRTQGKPVATHIVAADNALNAINLVESEYSEPVQTEMVVVENRHGHCHKTLVAKNWHGYTFEARALVG